MRKALIVLGCAVALLWAAGWYFTRGTVTEEKSLRFNDKLVVSYRIISEGGALGNERYEVFAERAGDRDKIFEGINGQHFGITRGGPDLIRIRFCGGTIEHLSAVYPGVGIPPIAVQPDVYCPDVRYR